MELTNEQYDNIMEDLKFHGGCYVCVHFDKDKPIWESCKIGGGCHEKNWIYGGL